MQALSFTAHIPLVCFGIAFPAMVLLMEWWGQRTGDPLYRTIARRWSRVMIALFAIGAITGTVLSFEMGVLWANFTATFGGVFGLGFAARLGLRHLVARDAVCARCVRRGQRVGAGTVRQGPRRSGVELAQPRPRRSSARWPL